MALSGKKGATGSVFLKLLTGVCSLEPLIVRMYIPIY